MCVSKCVFPSICKQSLEGQNRDGGNELWSLTVGDTNISNEVKLQHLKKVGFISVRLSWHTQAFVCAKPASSHSYLLIILTGSRKRALQYTSVERKEVHLLDFKVFVKLSYCTFTSTAIFRHAPKAAFMFTKFPSNWYRHSCSPRYSPSGNISGT